MAKFLVYKLIVSMLNSSTACKHPTNPRSHLEQWKTERIVLGFMLYFSFQFISVVKDDSPGRVSYVPQTPRGEAQLGAPNPEIFPRYGPEFSVMR